MEIKMKPKQTKKVINKGIIIPKEISKKMKTKQTNHGQESSARKDDVVLTSGVNTDVKILQTPDTYLQANSDKPTLADKEIPRLEESKWNTSDPQDPFPIEWTNQLFFRKEDVKQAIKDYQEWLNSKKCHCESCCMDKLREIFGEELYE